jgi:hypothetical protein
MNSYPRIESTSVLPEEKAEEAFDYPDGDERGDYQQVDSLRVARLSRAQARWEGGLSETPHRIETMASRLRRLLPLRLSLYAPAVGCLWYVRRPTGRGGQPPGGEHRRRLGGRPRPHAGTCARGKSPFARWWCAGRP